jgi:hypothetical protein
VCAPAHVKYRCRNGTALCQRGVVMPDGSQRDKQGD